MALIIVQPTNCLMQNNMKNIRLLVSIWTMFLALSISTGAQHLPNNYDTIKTALDEYIIDYSSSGTRKSVAIYNKDNRYNTSDPNPYNDMPAKYIDHGGVLVAGRLDDWDYHVINEILIETFGWERAMKYFGKEGSGGAGTCICYVYHPQTGQVLELYFVFESESSSGDYIFEITPSEIKMMEQQIKQRVVFEVRKDYEPNRYCPYGVMTCGLGFYWVYDEEIEEYTDELM